MAVRRSAACLVAEPPERRAFVLYVLLLLYVMVMRAAPVARRPGIRSRVNVQIGLSVRGSRACWNSLARPLRRLISSTGSLCLIPVGAVEPGSDREPYDKARVEIHAYLGLRRLLLDC